MKNNSKITILILVSMLMVIGFVLACPVIVNGNDDGEPDENGDLGDPGDPSENACLENYAPTTKAKLTEIITAELAHQNSNEADLSCIDTSAITDMSELFKDQATFNGKIGGWNVSNVTNMNSMFFGAKAFNQPLNEWNVSKVEDMNNMFRGDSAFNQDITGWIVSSVKSMTGMFLSNQKFNQAIGGWDVSSVTDMSYMFFSASEFVQDLEDWADKVGDTTNTEVMFDGSGLVNDPSWYQP